MSKKGKIYKLYCDDGCYYYGSTTSHYLSSRLCSHRVDSTRDAYKDNKVYSHIRSLGWDKVKIILVEEFEYTSREDMKRRENKFIVDGLNDPLCLNHNRAIVTDEERVQKVLDRHRRISSVKKEVVMCECGLEHTVGRTEQHKKSLKHRLRMSRRQLITDYIPPLGSLTGE